jgi:predicted DsbA family dithiol-disulfide isomerase
MSGRRERFGADVTEAIKVDIWSDVQCPWCYIGKRKFEKGTADFGGPVEVEYHSFELAPDTPLDFDGTSADYLTRRKGLAPDQVAQMLDRVTGIAASVGLAYNFDAVHQTNTVRAHEIIHLAKARGRQRDLVERLFRAYFIEGRHLGQIPELVDLAAEVGLDRDEALRALESNQYLADVKADVEQADRYGIHAVPFFVFEQKYGVSGAQDAEVFTQVLERIRDQKPAG